MKIRRTNNAVFYYHPNHLASTMYVTDVQQSVVQSFLYAPYGDIISEYNPGFNGNVLPNYAFNAKELDEETGMYYYEARYYAPPTFISRDPLMSEKPWLTPYHYCSNNPVGRVDPSGMFDEDNIDKWRYNTDTRKLEWISNEGGDYHQIVAETQNTSSGEKVNRTVEFDGAIGQMFDFSVVSKNFDGIFSGALELGAGAETAYSGIVIGAGGSVFTGGASMALGATIVGFSSFQIVSGVQKIAETLEGHGVDLYEQQNMVRDICKSAGNGIFGALSKVQKQSLKKNLISVSKSIGKSIASFTASTLWEQWVSYKIKHPKEREVLLVGAKVY